MHQAFREHGKAAIDKVIKQQPAVFLKLLVLLVPRELEVTHSAGVKGMTDDQIEQAIEIIEEMLARREAGETAKVVEEVATPVATPAIPDLYPIKPTKRNAKRKAKRALDVVVEEADQG